MGLVVGGFMGWSWWGEWLEGSWNGWVCGGVGGGRVHGRVHSWRVNGMGACKASKWVGGGVVGGFMVWVVMGLVVGGFMGWVCVWWCESWWGAW